MFRQKLKNHSSLVFALLLVISMFIMPAKQIFAETETDSDKRPSTITIELYAERLPLREDRKPDESKEPYTSKIAAYQIHQDMKLPKGQQTWGELVWLDEKYTNSKEQFDRLNVNPFSPKDKWQFQLQLPAYEPGGIGNKMTYSLKEVPVNGYQSILTESEPNVWEIVNVKNKSFSGSKSWLDDNNNDGKRPESITVNLLADGEVVASQVVSAATKWKYTFTNYETYDTSGKELREINYTIEEVGVDGYSTEITDETPAEEYFDYIYNITNTHANEKLDLSVSKVWNDADNRDGIRPAAVTVNLLADGVQSQSIELNAANDWKYTFKNLQRFNNGQEIKYTIAEVETANGYTAKISGNQDTGFVIENSHPITTTTTTETTETSSSTTAETNPSTTAGGESSRPTESKQEIAQTGEAGNITGLLIAVVFLATACSFIFKKQLK